MSDYWILTRSGARFDFIDPRPDQIRLLDIAHALSMQCRFAGHCTSFYSVAQHSVLVSQLVPHALALEALMHDAAEAYITDIPHPVKQYAGAAVSNLEGYVQKLIATRFGLPATPSDGIKHADLVALATERRDLMPEHAETWPILRGIEPHPDRIQPLSQINAYVAFFRRYVELMIARRDKDCQLLL